MARLLKRCAQCGAVDRGSDSGNDASDDAARSWTCSVCAWTEYDLVEDDGGTAEGSDQEENVR